MTNTQQKKNWKKPLKNPQKTKRQKIDKQNKTDKIKKIKTRNKTKLTKRKSEATYVTQHAKEDIY